MSLSNFTVVVNLSNFFSDHRHRARIFVNDLINTVQDLQDKITNVFGIRNFILTSNNEYLPSSEDVRILRSDDIIWVVPQNSHSFENEKTHIEGSSIPNRKRKSSTSKNYVDTYSPKKKQKRKSGSELLVHEIEPQSTVKKKRKNSIDEVTESTPMIKQHKKHKNQPDETEQQKVQDNCSKHFKIKSSEIPIKHKDRRLPDENVLECENKSSKKADKPIDNSKKKTKELSKIYQNSKIVPQTKNIKMNELDKEKPMNMRSTYSIKKVKDLPHTEKIKINGLDDENLINVGSSLPYDISYKKAVPIPTITDEYLKKKKINIVKINYISKPTVQNEETAAPAEREITNEEIQKQVENEPSVCEKMTLTQLDTLQAIVAQEKDDIFYSDPETCKEKENTNLDHYNHKLSVSVPTTKFFFLNTPTSKEKKEIKPIVKQKKENFFILKHYPLSPIATISVDENITETPTDLPKDQQENNVDKNEEKDKNEIDNIFKTKENVLQNSLKSINISTEKIMNVEEEKMELDNEIKRDNAKLENTFAPLVVKINSNPNYSSNYSDVSKKNVVEGDKNLHSSLITNDSFTEHNTDLHNNPILDETKLDELETYSEIENVEIEDGPKTVDIKHRLPGFGKLSTVILQDSCYLNKISPCINTLLESKNDQFEISGLKPIKSWSKKNVLGIGSLLNTLRKSETTSVDESPAVSDLSEFVTQRKRIRIRKRKKNKNKQHISIEETQTPVASASFKPVKSAAAPRMHIKFSENENESEDEVTDEGGNDTSIISIQSENEGVLDWNKKILESPVMSESQLPKMNDIIAFKVLKLSKDFTPGISTYVVGRVHNFFAETQVVTFEIVNGLEELQTPKGKFSINQKNDLKISSTYKEFRWSELIQPTLIFP